MSEMMPNTKFRKRKDDDAVRVAAEDKDVCSPASTRRHGEKKNRVEGSCLSRADVMEAGRLWNTSQKNAADRIPVRFLKDPVVVSRHIRDRVGREDIWMSTFVPRGHPLADRIRESLRPEMPVEWLKDGNTWLSNFDIDAVLRQYDAAHPEFKFLGVFPMDFGRRYGDDRCVSMEVCSFDVAQAWAQGVRKVAMVLNMDDHTGPGSHWVCVTVGLDPLRPNYGVFYYDSVALPPTQEVQDYADDLSARVNDIHASASSFPATRTFRLQYNTVRRQFGNTECGVFALFCVLCSLHDTLDFESVCEAMGTDEMIHEFRWRLFRPPR